VRRRGFTLLETMVALVILGLVVLSYVQLLGATVRSTRNIGTWTQAVDFAEAGMELAKVGLPAMLVRGRESLVGGFVRQIHSQPVGEGLQIVKVTVFLPDGGNYSLDRLFEQR